MVKKAFNVRNVEQKRVCIRDRFVKTVQLKRREIANGQWDATKGYVERVECANRILSR
jgi:hypothetical protein